MLTLILSFVGAAVLAVLGMTALGGPVWTILFAVLGFLLVSMPINIWVRKKQERVFKDVQAMIENEQNTIRRKVQMMQSKPSSSNKGVQKQLEKQQAAAIRNALQELNRADSLNRWNFLAERQTNTLRGQLHYQLKEFDKADQFFAKSLNLDPMTVSMKMARAYKRGDDEELRKLYNRGRKRFKGERGAMIYALYSWIQLKNDNLDDAIAALEEGKKKTGEPVLGANWEHLVNGRVRQFSNAGLGDLWYSLHLETPKPVRVKQRRGRGKF